MRNASVMMSQPLVTHSYTGIRHALGDRGCCSGISGGHINPAVRLEISSIDPFMNCPLQVTLSLAIFRRFSWRKVPIFIAAQTLGAMWAQYCLLRIISMRSTFSRVGAVFRTLSTASLFATYSVSSNIHFFPKGRLMAVLAAVHDAVSSFFSEFNRYSDLAHGHHGRYRQEEWPSTSRACAFSALHDALGYQCITWYGNLVRPPILPAILGHEFSPPWYTGDKCSPSASKFVFVSSPRHRV